MNIYLDTSSLFKLYQNESGSENLDDTFSNVNITDVFISEITKVEFVSGSSLEVLSYHRITPNQVTYFEAIFEVVEIIQINDVLIDQEPQRAQRFTKKSPWCSL